MPHRLNLYRDGRNASCQYLTFTEIKKRRPVVSWGVAKKVAGYEDSRLNCSGKAKSHIGCVRVESRRLVNYQIVIY
jgi:hypothetical protein